MEHRQLTEHVSIAGVYANDPTRNNTKRCHGYDQIPTVNAKYVIMNKNQTSGKFNCAVIKSLASINKQFIYVNYGAHYPWDIFPHESH